MYFHKLGFQTLIVSHEYSVCSERERLLIDVSRCMKRLVGNSEQRCCAVVMSHSSSSPLKIRSFFLGTHTIKPLSVLEWL